MNNPGKLIIFTAPSGAGKTTIVRHLLRKYPQLAFSVSATTRDKRPGEIDGRDYYFLTQDVFQQRVQDGAFAEWEEVYPGRFYGTLHSELDRLWGEGKTIVFDIEVKGATNLKEAYPDRSLAVFVKPPSPDVLFARLRSRNTETEESLRDRIARASEELEFENNFDRIIVNDALADTLQAAEAIVEEFAGIEPAT